PGQSVRYDGHVFTYVGSKRFSLPNKSGEIATVLVDGAPFHPAISVFPGNEGIGTPAVDSSVREDTYLTVADIDLSPHGPATIDVVIQPMGPRLSRGGAPTAFRARLAETPSPGLPRRAPVSRPSCGTERDLRCPWATWAARRTRPKPLSAPEQVLEHAESSGEARAMGR